MALKAFIKIMSQNKYLVCAILSIAVFLLTLVTLRHGVKAIPDSWSYWEGSVGFTEKDRFCYISGTPIVGWPPLFSLYLAFFGSLFGQTGKTLALAMSVLGALCAFTWGMYVFKLFENEKDRQSTIAYIGGLLFILFFTPFCSVTLYSNVLVLFFVGALFYQFACLDEKEQFWACFRGPAIMGIILCGCMLAHHSSLNFLATAVFAVLFISGATLRQRMFGTGIICFLSMVPWILVLHFMGEQGQHELGRTFTTYQYL